MMHGMGRGCTASALAGLVLLLAVVMNEGAITLGLTGGQEWWERGWAGVPIAAALNASPAPTSTALPPRCPHYCGFGRSYPSPHLPPSYSTLALQRPAED